MQSNVSGRVLDPTLHGKVLRDLGRLPANARRIHVEAAVWRSVTRHAGALSAEEAAEVTWQVLRDLVGGKKAA